MKYLFILGLLLLVASCKKDNGPCDGKGTLKIVNESQAGTWEISIDGEPAFEVGP